MSNSNDGPNPSKGESSLIEIGDLAGVSGPLEKLIESLSDGIAALYRRRRIVRDAEAEVEADLIRARGEAERRQLLLGAGGSVYDAMVEAKRVNLGLLLDTVAEEIDEDFSGEPPDADWLIDFLDMASNVSAPEMRLLWALLLKGELQQPGRFSRRTLHTVRTLLAEEADMFNTFCRCLWEIDSGDGVSLRGAILASQDPEGVPDTDLPGLDLHEVDVLDYVGLVSTHNTVYQEEPAAFSLTYFDRRFRVEPPDDEFVFDVVGLTMVGEEIADAIPADPHPAYAEQTLRYLRDRGFLVEEV